MSQDLVTNYTGDVTQIVKTVLQGHMYIYTAKGNMGKSVSPDWDLYGLSENVDAACRRGGARKVR